MTKPRAARFSAGLALALALAAAGAPPASAQTVKALQKEFLAIAKNVVPATVIVRAVGAEEGVHGSTGVIVHAGGWVLTDSAGPLQARARDKMTYVDAVEIRLPHPDTRRLAGRVVIHDEAADFTLVKIIDPPSDLPACPIGSSDLLQVGAFAYVCGNAFGSADEGKPALSAGLVSGLIPSDGADEGRFDWIYTSAKVNPGNNGGPLVDLEGRVIGIVSTFIVDPKSPHRAFGLVVPIDRIRAMIAKVTEARGALPRFDEDARLAMNDSRVLERAIQILAGRGASRLVSIEVDRGDHVAMVDVQYGRPPHVQVVRLPRYPGPYSGFVWDEEGHLVTTASNLLFAREHVKGITAVFPDGSVREAKLLAHDRFRDVALLKVDTNEPLPVFERAAKADLDVGSFLLALAQPFGRSRHEGPWVTFGVLSRDGQLGPVVDAIQTDAGLNEATAGGPIVDFEGKLVGMGVLITPDRLGRNSGIGFAVPHTSIAVVIDQLKRGESLEPGYFGIRNGFPQNDDGDYVVAEVDEAGPAYAAGLRAGDVILELDGTKAADFSDMMKIIERIRIKPAGAKLRLVVRRAREKIPLEVTMGRWPED